MVDKKQYLVAPGQELNEPELTTEEQTEHDQRATDWAADTAMRDWEGLMAATDILIPRYVEDIIDALPQAQRDAIAAETLDRYNDKKTKRGQKPV